MAARDKKRDNRAKSWNSGSTLNKAGELLKKSVFGHWKTRKFVLLNGILSYGSPDKPDKVKKIALSDCIIQNADSITNRPFSFGIFNSKLKNPILMMAKDIEEYNSWVEALEQYANPELKKLNIVSTLEDMNDGIIISNDKGIVTSFNRAAQELFGYMKHEILGKSVSILMPSTYGSIHDDFMQRYLETGENKIMGRSRRVTAKRKDGSTFPIVLSLGEISTNEGIRFIATMRAIYEDAEQTKKTQAVLEDTHKMIEEKLEAVKNSLDFEMSSLRDRILELEDDRKKFRDKSKYLQDQLAFSSRWREVVESVLLPDQLQDIQNALLEYHQNVETAKISKVSQYERVNRKNFDFLTRDQLDTLLAWLPEHVNSKSAMLVFSSEDHATRNLEHFYNRVNPDKITDPQPTLLMIKTSKGEIFGAYLSHLFRKSNQYFGNGDSFLFSLHPQQVMFGWSSNQPPFFLMCAEEELLIGGGSTGYGLRLNLEIGWSQRCDTFQNEPLTTNPKDPFKIALLQVYKFESSLKHGSWIVN